MSEDLRPQWPHLENMDRVLKDCPDFLTRPDTQYVVTEKVHGFNARFGVDAEGIPWVGSRNQVVADGDPTRWPDGLQGFVRFAASVLCDQEGYVQLRAGVTLFGEWAGKGVQKGIDYGVPRFFLFGAMDFGELLPWSLVEQLGRGYGLNLVPVLRLSNGVPTAEQLLAIRDRASSIAPTNGEGVVVYAYPVPTDVYGHRVIMKVKAPAFEERTRFRDPNKGQPKSMAPGVQAFAEEYCTAMRLEHVLQQVKDSVDWPGKDKGIVIDVNPLDVEYTGFVMRAMVEDCIREGRGDYDRLTEDEQKAVGKAINPRTKEHLTAARDAATLAA